MFVFSLLFLDKKKVPDVKILHVRDDVYRGATLFQKYALVLKNKKLIFQSEYQPPILLFSIRYGEYCSRYLSPVT